MYRSIIRPVLFRFDPEQVHYFTFSVLARQDITWSHPTVQSLLIMYGILLLLSVLLMWVYYRIVYGMLLRRLGRNLEQLKKIEQGN